MTTAVVYGLSTEGYNIASSLSIHGITTVLVDEGLQMAMQLKPQVAKSLRSLSELLEEETLLGLESTGAAIGRAEYIFFAPKIRRSNEEVLSEVNIRLREVAKYLARNTIFVSNVPTRIGGTTENILLLEKLSGLKVERDFQYIYAPVIPGSQEFAQLGFRGKPNKAFIELMNSANMKATTPTSIEIAELLHAYNVLENYLFVASSVELIHRIEKSEERIRFNKLARAKEVFLDDLTAEFFDLRTILSTLGVNEPLSHLASGIVKSVDGYIRRLVDEVRAVMKTRDLKASKTRVILSWSADKYEMRGERLRIRDTLVDRLKDYIGDISIVESMSKTHESKQKNIRSHFDNAGKTEFIICCSSSDFLVVQKSASQRSELHEKLLMKANLFYELVPS